LVAAGAVAWDKAVAVDRVWDGAGEAVAALAAEAAGSERIDQEQRNPAKGGD
jgi:hypothetical protein